MTRLLTTGWETGDINEAGVSVIGASATQTVVTATPTPRAGGSYCLKFTDPNNNNCYKNFNLGAPKTDVWLRFGVFVHASTGELPLAVFIDSGTSGQNCLTFTASDGLLRLRQDRSSGGTLLGTSSSAMTQDVWHLIEYRCQMTSTSAGTSEVWLDGTRVINFSGDNSATANANFQIIWLGISAWSVSSGSTYVAFDDIAINDTNGTINNGKIGDGCVVLLKPTGAGSNTNMTRGGTDTGANWSQTSELPPSAAQYVYSGTAATRDTYALADLPVTPASINAVEVLVMAQNDIAGTGSLGLTVKSGGTTNEGSAQALTTTAAYYRQLYETDPNTSAAWTNAAVNALEAGATVR